MRRRVLVTGASRGIGRAVAHAFATAGDRVAKTPTPLTKLPTADARRRHVDPQLTRLR